MITKNETSHEKSLLFIMEEQKRALKQITHDLGVKGLSDKDELDVNVVQHLYKKMDKNVDGLLR